MNFAVDVQPGERVCRAGEMLHVNDILFFTNGSSAESVQDFFGYTQRNQSFGLSFQAKLLTPVDGRANTVCIF